MIWIEKVAGSYLHVAHAPCYLNCPRQHHRLHYASDGKTLEDTLERRQQLSPPSLPSKQRSTAVSVHKATRIIHSPNSTTTLPYKKYTSELTVIQVTGFAVLSGSRSCYYQSSIHGTYESATYGDIFNYNKIWVTQLSVLHGYKVVIYKLEVAQLVQISTAFYGTQKKCITILKLSSQLQLHLPIGFLHLGFATKTLWAFLSTAHLDFVTLIIFGEEY